MKTKLLLTLLSALAAGAICLSGTAVAQGHGGGGGNGGGGGGDEGAPDFGDLIILYRYDNGVPIPSDPVEVPNPETGATVWGGECWQPLAEEEFSYDGWTEPEDRVVVPTASTAVDGGWLIPVDQYNCAVEAFFGAYTREVDFGRINEARSPESVFEAQLEDVVVKLATADSTSLDPAGRMVASNCGDDEETVTSTIDSPLQNLAVYRQLMLTGTIGIDLPEGADRLETAARGLGVASDKGGAINVDMVAYLNMIMGLDTTEATLLPKRCETYREEVQGTIQEVDKCFLDYSMYDHGNGQLGYAYDRAETFGALPSPAYIFTGEYPEGEGIFEYLSLVTADPPSFEIVKGPILEAVPELMGDPTYTGDNIGAFAVAADDTRAVINFMHDWPIPYADLYGTPVPCEPSSDILYDLAISEQSGLQVPKNYVNGGEREFFINVGNLGPDPANGTVTVIATGAEGALGEWNFDIEELPAGETASFTQFFTISTSGRTISWTATVAAGPPGTDPNPGNNTVKADTVVRASGGGGGH